jgi:hypothetical protein
MIALRFRVGPLRDPAVNVAVALMLSLPQSGSLAPLLYAGGTVHFRFGCTEMNWIDQEAYRLRRKNCARLHP